MFGFGYGFGLMQLVVPLFILVVLAVIVVVLAKNVAQWHRNNQSPRLTVEAEVVSRRDEVTTHQDAVGGEGMTHVRQSTAYYATFQVDSGDRMEFLIPREEIGFLREGDRGRLTFQGTRFLEFERF